MTRKLVSILEVTITMTEVCFESNCVFNGVDEGKLEFETMGDNQGCGK